MAGKTGGADGITGHPEGRLKRPVLPIPADRALTVESVLARARAAQKEYSACDQRRVDEVVTALGWSIVHPDNNRLLAEMAVADTGMGNVEDKIVKNRRKTIGLLRDLQHARTVGVVAEYAERGIIEIARPVGVVGAIVPSTNPAATPANKAINAVKGRNAIILAPSPKGDRVCAKLVELMQAELGRVGAPLHLVQKLPSPVNRQATRQLMSSVDLIVATGSQNNVRAAYSSGTPAIGVGAGNVVSIIDETAQVEEAAEKIVISKSFDNATSCSSENNLIVVDSVYEAALATLEQRGAVLLDAHDKSVLEALMWRDGRLNPDIIARSAAEIATLCGLRTGGAKRARILLIEQAEFGEGARFSGEKLCPVLSVYRATDFAEACAIAEGIMDYQGKGHSISIHTTTRDRPLAMGLNLPVCRVIVNQIHCYATGGSFDNGLPFSLSMGCGSWGGNSISDNLNYRNYLNTTRVSWRITPREPSEQELFADYWERYQCRPVCRT